MRRVEAYAIAGSLVLAGWVLLQAVTADAPVPEAPPTPPTATAVQPEATETIVVTQAPPSAEVTGVPGSVGAVLAGAGHAEFVSASDLSVDLPESVVATLVAADVTLRIPEGSP